MFLKIVLGLIAAFFIFKFAKRTVLRIKNAQTKPKTVRLARFEDYKVHTDIIHKSGRNASASYNENTGRITFDYGTPDTYKEKSYADLIYKTPDGKVYTDRLNNCYNYMDEIMLPHKIGTVGTIVYNNKRFAFNAADNQEEAKTEFWQKQESIRQKKEATQNSQYMQVWRFVSKMLPTFLAATLSIIMPQLVLCLFNNGDKIFTQSDSLMGVVVGILSAIISILAIILYYASFYGHVVLVPYISYKFFNYKISLSKHYLMSLLGLAASYATGGLIEYTLSEIGLKFTEETAPYFGTMANTVILCGFITITLFFIMKSIRQFNIRKRAKLYEKYNDLFNQK